MSNNTFRNNSFKKSCWNNSQRNFVPAIIVGIFVPTMIVKTAVPTRVVGTSTKNLCSHNHCWNSCSHNDCWNSCSNNHCLNGILLEILPFKHLLDTLMHPLLIFQLPYSYQIIDMWRLSFRYKLGESCCFYSSSCSFVRG